MSLLRNICFGLVILVQLQSAAIAKQPVATLTRQDRELFAWFDKLGIESFYQAPLVRVRTGAITYRGTPGQRQPDEPRAFLLWQKGDEFRVLLGDLTAITLRRQGPGPEDDDYCGFRKVSYAAEVASLERTLRQKELNGFWDDGHDSYSDRLELPAQLFVLARYGAAQGDQVSAARLLRVCARIMRAEKARDLEQSLQQSFGSLLYWLAVVACADPAQNRRQQAQAFRIISELCPENSIAAEAADTARELEAMAVEDEAHPIVPPDALAQLTPAEQAHELVFQLRDDNPDMCDVWMRPWPFVPSAGNGAAGWLKLLGHPAVPALLAALGDERPSRSAFRNHRYGGSVRTLAIRELASNVLDEIAGVNFFYLCPYSASPDLATKWVQMRRIAGEWWQAVQAGQEADWLEGRASRNEDGAGYCLDALAKRFPARFQATAIRAVQAVSAPWSRSQLLRRLWTLDTPEVNAFLLAEATSGATIGNRVAAAYPLRQRHHPEILAAMLQEWSVLVSAGPLDFSTNEGTPNSAGHLLDFPLSSDSAEAQRAAIKPWPQFGIETKVHVLDRWDFLLRSEGDQTIQVPGPETRAVIRRLLIDRLADNSPTNFESNDLEHLTLAEFAAGTLAEAWPQEFHFNQQPNRKKRAAQLAAIRAEAARADQGQSKP